jgi:hypothetical protein
MAKSKGSAIFLSALFLPVLSASAVLAQNANPVRPGTVNYIEGSASIDGRPIARRVVGSAGLGAGETIATDQGKAEVLLTPGVFFRLDDFSAARMVSPDLTDTVMQLDKGRAAVEVDQLFPQNDIQIVMDGVPTRLLKPGLYEFDADRGAVRVFEGKATVVNHENERVTLNGHHEFAFAAAPNLKPASFDTKVSTDEIYNWSSLRSEYLAQANTQIAGEYGYNGFAPGWYWNPYFDGYTFVGLDPFWSPFGWGFYGGGFYGRGFYGGGYGGRGGFAGRGGYGGGFGGGGFHGGGGGRR